MAENEVGNVSDHEQFVSAEESDEENGVVNDPAIEPAEEVVIDEQAENNNNVAEVVINEAAVGLEVDDDSEEEEDLAFNVAEADEALLLNAEVRNLEQQQQLEARNNRVNNNNNDDEDGEMSSDEDLDDDEEDDQEIMEEEEEEGEEVQEVEHPLGIQAGNKISPGPGCSHYRRGCALVAPCCNRQYPCRHCHNENEGHEINRFAIAEVVCLTCEKRQPITDRCIQCAALFGNYVCLKCRVWDMDFKGQWHCDGCGICRLGGKDHFFHCDRCGYCLSVALRGDHRCIERATRTGCAICLSDLHDTRTPLVVPACGHPVHRSCWRQMIDSRRYFCPTCRRAVVDLTDIWADLDTRIGDQLNRLPAEFCLPIFCNDCQQHSSVRYNIIGYFKCPGCGSYNTQR